MMSCYEQMRANEEIQSRPESGRDTPFDLNFLKVDINVNRVLKVRCPNVLKEKKFLILQGQEVGYNLRGGGADF